MKDYVVTIERKIVIKAESPIKAINEIAKFWEKSHGRDFAYRASERRMNINDYSKRETK